VQWRLSDEQRDYQEAFRGWLAKVAPADKVRGWLSEADHSVFESRFVADGWAGVGLPESLGGQGGGLVELALTAEELARAAAPSSTWLAGVLAAPALGGSQELAATTAIPADVVPEADACLEIGGGGAVTGAVPRVLAADNARRFIVPVADELRVVDADDVGVRVTSRCLLDRSRSVADVSFDGARSEALHVDAETVLQDMAARAAVLIAADSLGATERMLELAVEYSKQRKQFGRPIGSFQAVKHAAATILVGVEAARSVVYFAAASVDSDQPQSLLHAAAAKAQVTAEGVRAADSALTMHGAIGYTWEHDLHFYYKRAKLDEPLFGTPEVWNALIADSLALV
jgi:alkylation response protein AidB-like acyl-CoA dehydrogenase